MKSLDQIAKDLGTDKSSEIHDYCRKYEKYLPFGRNDNLKILEIGVLGGQSLKMWKEYYPNALIYGIDINPDALKHKEDRISIEIGSQNDEVFLEMMKSDGPFDMVLDDGSHMMSDVIFSFKHLFESIKPGGVYVVEDTCTSYWKEFGGATYKKGTTIEHFKEIIDEVNFFGERGEVISAARREDYLIPQIERKGHKYTGSQIESLNFLNSIILITKR